MDNGSIHPLWRHTGGSRTGATKIIILSRPFMGHPARVLPSFNFSSSPMVSLFEWMSRCVRRALVNICTITNDTSLPDVSTYTKHELCWRVSDALGDSGVWTSGFWPSHIGCVSFNRLHFVSYLFVWRNDLVRRLEGV